jgi:dephospho-CoA kinase
MIIGLTGGICCGKSTIAKTFVKHNIPVVDADILARIVVEPGTEGLAKIQSSFGQEYLNSDGTLNRIKLGNLVFSSKYVLNVLNKIMFPLIDKEKEKQFSMLRDQGHQYILYDAAIVVESGNADKYRPLIIASCSKEAQLSRLMKRNNLTEAQAMDRINSQMPNDERIKFADFIIDTSNEIEQTIVQTETIIKNIKDSNVRV